MIPGYARKILDYISIIYLQLIKLIHTFGIESSTIPENQWLMKTFEILERYQKIDRLIKRRSTGNPKSFAKKLGISKSQLFNYLEELRDRGAEISYNKTLESYIYRRPVEITAIFSVRIKDDEDRVSENEGLYMPCVKAFRNLKDQKTKE